MVITSLPTASTTTTVTATSTDTITTTPTTTVTTTTTVANPDTTVSSYAACATNNLVTTYAGNQISDLTFTGDEEATSAIRTTDDATPYDCCVSAILDDTAAAFVVFEGTCYIIDSSICTNVDQSETFNPLLNLGVQGTVGNAYCGEVVAPS